MEGAVLPRIELGYVMGQRPAVVEGRKVDYWLLGAIVTLLGIGIVMVLSAGYFVGAARFGDSLALIRKHLVFVGLSTMLGALLCRQDLSARRGLVYPLLWFGLLLLMMVLIPGIGQIAGPAIASPALSEWLGRFRGASSGAKS